MGLGGRAVVALSGPSLIILAAGRARRYGGVKQLAPIGKHGEGVIDLLASDAWASGFEDIVIIVNSETGKQIEEHVAARWPKEHKVSFAVQSRLRGTVDAVLAAENNLDLSKPFGVSNADDLYGRAAFLLLGERLAASPHNCLVGFELDRALVGDLPVSRGTCMVEDGRLTEIVERRNVHSTLEGYDADDGLEPVSLSPLATVSMNLWGFQPSIIPLMHKSISQHSFETDSELQLSTFVGQVLESTSLVFEVLPTRSRCIGITHAKDLPVSYAWRSNRVIAPNTPSFEPTTASGLNAGVDDRFRRSILQQRFEQRCQSARCELLVARFSDLTHRPPPRARQTLRQEFLLRERRCNDIRRSVHEEELLVLTRILRELEFVSPLPDDGTKLNVDETNLFLQLTPDRYFQRLARFDSPARRRP